MAHSTVSALYTPFQIMIARTIYLSASYRWLTARCQHNHFDLMLFAAFGTARRRKYTQLSDGASMVSSYTRQDDALVQCLHNRRWHVVAITDSVPGLAYVICDNADGMRQVIE
jgi:DNA-binding LacI/PurR family transcriptional regulator